MKLSKKQKQDLKKIAEKYKLKLIILFGSFAIGKNRLTSDIDIAVLAEKEINFQSELALIGDLTNIFKQKIDLSIVNRVNPLLLQQISKNAILLYGKREDFINFKLYAFHRYNDYKPFFKIEEQFIKKLVKRF